MIALGIDIGGSSLKGALVDCETGDLVAERHKIPTPSPAKPMAMAKAFVKIVEHFSWKGPIGCGFPAVIKNGIALTATNIHKTWIGTNVIKLFSQESGNPVHVLNDADAAGIAERQYGAGKGKKGNIVMVTVGTGIGTALFTNGELYENTELGHILLKKNKTAEEYCSDRVRKKKNLSWKKWGKRFNFYLEDLDKLIRPELIIIGGGVTNKEEKFFKYIKLNTEVAIAKNLNNAGIKGSAAFACNNTVKS